MNRNLYFSIVAVGRSKSHIQITTRITIDVNGGYMVHWRGLDPYALPDSAARSVEYVRRAQCLLSYGNDIIATVRRIMSEDNSADIRC